MLYINFGVGVCRPKFKTLTLSQTYERLKLVPYPGPFSQIPYPAPDQRGKLYPTLDLPNKAF